MLFNRNDLILNMKIIFYVNVDGINSNMVIPTIIARIFLDVMSLQDVSVCDSPHLLSVNCQDSVKG